MKYDPLDLKIIRKLQEDGRISFAEIARQLKVKPGVVQARYAKMKKTGLIIGSTLSINPSKIGIMRAASIGIEAYENNIKEVKKYIEGLKFKDAVIDVWLTFGRYNISVALWLKNFEKIFKIKQLIKRHPYVVNVDISLTQDFVLSIKKLDIEKILE